jgi:hypothetical protein
MSVVPFLLAAVTALVIALVTVSYQTFKAAFRDPVDSLRYECRHECRRNSGCTLACLFNELLLFHDGSLCEIPGF